MKVSIETIIENPTNPRKITEEMFDKLVRSIQEDPAILEAKPLVVEKKDGMYVVIGGNMRFKALKHLGYEEVPIFDATDWSSETKRRFIVKDNLSNGMWDYDLLSSEYELEELSNWGMEGLDKYFIEDPDEKDEAVPETPPVPKSKAGDVYQLGSHRLMCGDATKVEDVEKLMGGVLADLIVTDPPYNVDYTGKTKEALKIDNDRKDDADFREFLRDSFASMVAFMKAGAVFYVWHADSEGYNFRGALKDVGLVVRQCLIWEKDNMVLGRQDYHWKHEPCLYGWKEGAGHLWNSDRTQTTLLKFNRPTKNKEHPTMKPVELLAYQITNNTKGQDVVLDLFLGSGSTLIASEKTQRICYGLELDPKYVDVIVQRYVDFTGNEDILLNGQPITWPKKITNNEEENEE